MTALVGLVAGTVFYHQDYFAHAEKKVVDTKYGPATVLLTDRWAYVPRHGLEGGTFIPPHKINHPANMAVLKDLGVKEVIGVCSCGSLRPSLRPGSVVLPSDYISLSDIPTIFDDERGHIIPVINEKVRNKLAGAAEAADVEVIHGGIYWQNRGPRLETKAEIRLQSHYADMVGMTMASEATIAQELKLKYASLCSVDNLAHGLAPNALTNEQILANAAENSKKIFRVLQSYIEQ